MLIVGAYPDSLESDDSNLSAISQLKRLIDQILPDEVAVHLLPFYPTSGDFGFAIDDWSSVRPELGSWQDVRDLGSSRPLIVDGVYNHVGIGHDWVRAFMSSEVNNSEYLHAYRVGDDITGPMSPRGQSVLQPYSVASEPWYLWQTFSERAVDIRLDNPYVLSAIDAHLELLQETGVWAVRLDAVAYYAKSPGSGIRHNPGVFDLAAEIASMVEARGMHVIAQIDCDLDGLRYFAEDSQTHYAINDFSYAVYLALSMITKNPKPLATHLMDTSSLGHPCIRSPRNHDGLLLRSGRIGQSAVDTLMAFAASVGIETRISGGTPYELNCSAPYLYSRALPSGCSLESAIELSIIVTGMTDGWSYFYLPSILGYMPEMAVSPPTHSDPRALNRLTVPLSAQSSFLGSSRRLRLHRVFQVLARVHTDRSNNIRTDAQLVSVRDEQLLCLTSPSSSYRLITNFGNNSARVDHVLRGETLLANRCDGKTMDSFGYVLQCLL